MRLAAKLSAAPASLARDAGLHALILLSACALGPSGRAQSLAEVVHSHEGHETAEWTEVAAHLPDPATAGSARLEMAADVLRARRFHADALRFYDAALTQGADPRPILKKMGITCLEMGQPTLARLLFGRAVHLDKRDAVAWNDMAATELALGRPRAAVGEYGHAIKLDRNNAVFHANLALAYFEVHAPDSAREELAKAIRLDPDILHKTDSGGYNAQVLSADHYAEICFEMAHVYAGQNNVPLLLEWLSKASERGLDLHEGMGRDSLLRPWLGDARVQVLLQNQRLLSASNKGPTGVPSLGPAPQ